MLLYLKWHKLVKSVCYGLVGVLCNVLNTLLCQVWNVADGRELAVCSKHDGWVSSCWFSSDSDFLVSVSNNIKVRVYIFFYWNIYSFVTCCLLAQYFSQFVLGLAVVPREIEDNRDL